MAPKEIFPLCLHFIFLTFQNFRPVKNSSTVQSKLMIRVALKIKMPTEINFSEMSTSLVSPTFNYFAYGSNLSSERIRVSNPSAQAIGPALLQNYALDFNYHSKVMYKPSFQGMLWHALGWEVNFLSLQHFILTNLSYCPACKPELARVAIKAVSQRREKKMMQRIKNHSPCLMHVILFFSNKV